MIRVAVLSDVHAYSSAELAAGESKPSFAEISGSSNPAVNPFAAVHELIAARGLKADVLVSGGDLGDKASPQSLRYAWGEVLKVRDALEATVLLPATGNHDMDSRGINGYDARGSLQALQDYPFSRESLNDAYWANNVVVQDHGSYRSVLLNSSAYHGYNDEWKHGRISDRTRLMLRKALSRTSDPGVNLLITHHHLYPIGGVNLTDYSEMKEASALLDILQSGEFGSWMVIHGHRHWPSLSRAGGSLSAPTVFSAGSFSAVLYEELQDKARNQFYMLEIEPNPAGHRVRGSFTAWDWIADQGFLPARERSGLPHRGGFGGTLNGAELADRVAEFYDSAGQPFVAYDVVVGAIPDLAYAMPGDWTSCTQRLREKYQLSVLSDQEQPVQIGRRS